MRLCPRCHHRWPFDWEYCPDCAVYLPGTERTVRIVHLVPDTDEELGKPDAAGWTPPLDVATDVLLTCDIRCSCELPAVEDLQAAGALVTAVADAAWAHEGVLHVVRKTGVAVSWRFGRAGLDVALRMATALVSLCPPSERMLLGRLEPRVHFGIGIVSIAAAPSRDIRARWAVRLSRLAPPYTVLVSHEAYRETVDRFDYQGVVPSVPRSDPLPGPVFRLLGPKPERSGTHHVGAERVRLVGRRDALATLENAVGEVTSGHAGVLHLIAEPGMGKSRLVREWLTHLPPNQYRLLMTHGVPYGGYPWRAWRNLVEPLRDEQPGWTLTVPAPALTAAEAVAVLRIAGPTVLIVDDVHWLDPESLLAVARLISELIEAPALVVLAYRPSFAGRIPHAVSPRERRIRLAGLTDHELEALVATVWTDHGLPAIPATQRVIVDRAGGNPLYALEAVAYLVDTRAEVVPWPPRLPVSLPDLLLHRIEWLVAHRLPDLRRQYRERIGLGRFSLVHDRATVFHDLDAVEEQLAGWLDRFDVVAEDEEAVKPFLRGLAGVDAELAILSLLLGRQRPHHQRLTQALRRLAAREFNETASTD